MLQSITAYLIAQPYDRINESIQKQSVLTRLKNKYLLTGLAIISPLLLIAGVHQSSLTDVKGISVSVTVAPTETPTPTPVPDTPTPTFTPTNTPRPVRKDVAPTTVSRLPTQAPAGESNAQLDNSNYDTNSAGNTVHSPAKTIDGRVPAGATAQCGDGTYSLSQSHRGTCSHHGGVAQWL